MHRMADRDGIYGFRYFLEIAAAVAMASIFLKIAWKRNQKGVHLPPGPPPLPVIGNLHMVGKLPHRDLQKLAQKYGPIMFMRLGCIPTVVVSSAEMAKEFLKTHDLNFASRPISSFGKNIMYDSSSLAFSTYGPYWKQLRKVVSGKLLGPRTIESLKTVRSEEMACMVDGLMEHCLLNDSSPVDFDKLVGDISNHMTCRMTFGKKYADQDIDSKGFNELIQEFFYLAGIFNVGDFIPWLERFDVQGLTRSQKNIHKKFDAFLDRVLEEHLQSRATGQVSSRRDFLDMLLDLMLDKDSEEHITGKEIKATMLDMMVAGIDTATVTLQWAMSELVINPSIMKKAQEEVDNVVGMDCKLVEEINIPHLEYLLAVVKETLRVHPPVPLLLPHESMEDCTISGYHIPSKSRIIVNSWAISKDPHSWGDDVGIFRPERFIGSAIDVKGQHFEIVPFGAGRRICPGLSLGMHMVQLVLANLLHCFEWKLPGGMAVGDLDMSEGFGLTAHRAVHLQVVPTPRLHKNVLQTKI